MTRAETPAAVGTRGILYSAAMVRALLSGAKTKTRRVVKPQPRAGLGYQPMWGTSPDGVAFGTPGVICQVGPDYPDGESDLRRCPYGAPGDRLWVRETWTAELDWPDEPGQSRFRWWHEVPTGFRSPKNAARTYYRADASEYEVADFGDGESDLVRAATATPTRVARWESGRFMPRWASRLWLEVVAVRVERLQAITEADALAEGLSSGTKDGRLVKYGLGDRDGEPASRADGGWPWYDWCASPIAAYAQLWDEINAKRGYPWASNPWVWVLETRVLTPPDRDTPRWAT